MSYIRKLPSGKFNAELSYRGVRRSKAMQTRRDAERWLNEQRRDLDLGTWIDERRARATLNEVFARWDEANEQTRAGNRRRSDELLWNAHVHDSLGEKPVSQITEGNIRQLVAKAKTVDGKRTLSPSSQARILRLIRGALETAVDERRIARNPASKVRVRERPVKAREALAAPELKALRNELNDPLELCAFLAQTGLRFSEAAALNVGDVKDGVIHVRARWVLDGDGHRVRQEGLKNGDRGRRVPLTTDAARIAADRARGARPSSPLFRGSQGGRIDRANWVRDTGWRAAVKKLGHPDLTPHALRHTAATLLLAASHDVKAVQAILGHRSAKMTLDLYGHVLDDAPAKAVAALERLTV